MTKKHVAFFLAQVMAITSLAGCGSTATKETDKEVFADKVYTQESETIDLGMNLVPLASGGPISLALMPIASGQIVYKNKNVKIDASNSYDGYVMISYAGTTTKKLKVMIKGPSGVQYTYDLNKRNGEYEVFPLSDGNGTYSVGVYENISGTTYSTAFSKKITVTLKNEFEPFLYPNQYVNYNETSQTVAMAKALTAGKTSDLEKVSVIYKFIINSLTYDKEKAATVTAGYVPNLDKILETRKGICFDYASLMTAMLRSQGIPTKLVIGYTGDAYHAWINTYTKEQGWVDQVIYFDGQKWKLMDPTFASSAQSSAEIMKYIGNGNNYQAKYLY